MLLSRVWIGHFPVALYYMCMAPGLWGSFVLLILSKRLPQLCPSASCRVTLLTCTSSTTLHFLSVSQEGFSPKPFLQFPLWTSSSSVLHAHLCLRVLFPGLARSATESILFSQPALNRKLRDKKLYLLLLVVDEEQSRADVLLVPRGVEKWGRQTKAKLEKTWIECERCWPHKKEMGKIW